METVHAQITKYVYKDNNTCYNAIEKQNTWEFAGVRAHRAGEKGTE